jgi:hypothetical protein
MNRTVYQARLSRKQARTRLKREQRPPPNKRPAVTTHTNHKDNKSNADTYNDDTDYWLQYGAEFDVDLKTDEIKNEVKEEINAKKEEKEEEDTYIEAQNSETITHAYHAASVTPLYEGAQLTALEAVILVHQYLINSDTNKKHTDLLMKLILTLLPNGSIFPPSLYMLMKVCTSQKLHNKV